MPRCMCDNEADCMCLCFHPVVVLDTLTSTWLIVPKAKAANTVGILCLTPRHRQCISSVHLLLCFPLYNGCQSQVLPMQGETSRTENRSGARRPYRAHMATRLLLHRLREHIQESQTMQAACQGGRGPQQDDTCEIVHRVYSWDIFLERIRSTRHRCPRGSAIVWWVGDRDRSASFSSHYAQVLSAKTLGQEWVFSQIAVYHLQPGFSVKGVIGGGESSDVRRTSDGNLTESNCLSDSISHAHLLAWSAASISTHSRG